MGPFTRAERARQAEGAWEGRAVRVIKPQTYMNRSGAALAPLRDVSGFDPASHLLVLSDDVALPVGRFRLRQEPPVRSRQDREDPTQATIRSAA